jgi:hypothetical protein
LPKRLDACATPSITETFAGQPSFYLCELWQTTFKVFIFSDLSEQMSGSIRDEDETHSSYLRAHCRPVLTIAPIKNPMAIKHIGFCQTGFCEPDPNQYLFKRAWQGNLLN